MTPSVSVIRKPSSSRRYPRAQPSGEQTLIEVRGHVPSLGITSFPAPKRPVMSKDSNTDVSVLSN